MGLSVLMVAEKPSLAQSIAGFLSDGAAYSRRGATDVHEWEGAFRSVDMLACKHTIDRFCVGSILIKPYRSLLDWNQP
jgi:hypothetical protein